MKKWTYFRTQRLMLLLTLFTLGASFYLQYITGLMPCPLCLMQRGCALLFALMCLFGVRVPSLVRSRAIVILQLFFALSGLFFASRQLWLQSLPPGQAPACLPGLDTLIRYFPWTDVARALFWGSGECSEVTWRFFGFSMPAWAALFFFLLSLGSGLLLFFLKSTKKQ